LPRYNRDDAISDMRPVLVPAALLSTVGVAITAGLTAVAAYFLFDVSAPEAFLLGAVVGSTDAATVRVPHHLHRLRGR
jgi:cell volume regulation protein A